MYEMAKDVDKLTDKEKEEIKNLPAGFNIIKEDSDYNYMNIRRTDFSRETAKKLFRLSFILNCLSMVLFALAIAYLIIRPSADFYATTPSGKVYGPLPKLKR